MYHIHNYIDVSSLVSHDYLDVVSLPVFWDYIYYFLFDGHEVHGLYDILFCKICIDNPFLLLFLLLFWVLMKILSVLQMILHQFLVLIYYYFWILSISLALIFYSDLSWCLYLNWIYLIFFLIVIFFCIFFMC